ncbi:hypothetical protein [Candidatus Uabimicrobium amorphum]|uniref:Uncharacterized protein n=1 Tax=Uabimicrobium amorphum TaxID=2596890 RepID=A0A5S9F3B1_UABAM|nr:hypothetical protein [Candidatus Uabimicrobium amorphum]BBM84486.1 hypothetical protein UABAM_02847 [Candidatus Uabimicrobium amorphum]
MLIIYGVIEYLDGELTGKTIVKVKKKCPKTTGPLCEVVEGAGGRIEVEVTGRISSVMLDPEIEDYYKMSVGKKYLVETLRMLLFSKHSIIEFLIFYSSIVWTLNIWEYLFF